MKCIIVVLAIFSLMGCSTSRHALIDETGIIYENIHSKQACESIRVKYFPDGLCIPM